MTKLSLPQSNATFHWVKTNLQRKAFQNLTDLSTKIESTVKKLVMDYVFKIPREI